METIGYWDSLTGKANDFTITTTTGGFVPTLTTSSGTISYPFYDGWWWYQPVRVESPRECSGDLHVFPCPHCAKCKCGGATKTPVKAKGKR